MENFDVNSFDFETMNNAIGTNPFENDKKDYADERFYKLDKDKAGNGHAIIALMPDKNKRFIIKMYKIETTLDINGSKQWINAWSPRSIGKPCPFHQTYIDHWNEDKDIARQFKTKEKWICNIKIIKDPVHPENEGKIFLYAFSKTMAEKIQATVNLSESEIQMGIQRKEIFNPLKGYVMNLKCYKADTGFTSYDNAEFMQLPNGKTIYGDLNDEAKKKCYDDVVNHTYDLSELQKPENFMSYDDLYKELERICRGTFGIGSKSSASPKPKDSQSVNIETDEPKSEVNTAPTATTATVTPTESAPTPTAPTTTSATDDLDAFLKGL